MYDTPFPARTNVSSLHIAHAPKDDGSHASWSSLVGIITAIIGNILISFALNTQRYAHVRIDREYHDGQEKNNTQRHTPKAIRGYGSTAQQEQAADECARLNAEAPGPGNDADDDTNAFGQTQKRKSSVDSDETAKSQEKDDQNQPERKSYLKSPYWWVGIILMTIGEAGNFLAYGFAPASIVSPLGVVALISNCLIAPLMLKERFRTRDFWGVVISIGGAVTVVFSAKTSEVKMGPDDLWDAIKRWEFLTYIGITCVLIILLMIASPRYGKRTITIDLSLVGLFGGYTALSTKGVASMISGSLFQALTFPITYPLIVVLIVSAIMQIRYINRALSNFDSTQVIPTQFVLFTLSVIIGSAVLYRDFEKMDLDHVLKFIVGCALTFSGVWLITSGRKNNDDEDDDGTHDETIHLIDEEAEMEDERASKRQGQSLKLETDLETSKTRTRSSTGELEGYKAANSVSVPSLLVTPYDEALDQNPWTSSNEHVDGAQRPRTPSNPRELINADGTPFFTPGSAPSTAVQGRVGMLNRVGSSPADPQTPTRGSQALSGPPEPDSSLLAPEEIIETPQGIFRSARGSISRLIPGPFLGPLSSSSLNMVVAESLLKGEGSPQGPVRTRSYQRRIRPPQSFRTERTRRRSLNIITGAGDDDLENGLAGAGLTRWHTRDSGRPSNERAYTENLDGGEGSSRGFLPSLSPTLSRLMSAMRERGKDPERDELGEGSSNTHREREGK